MIVSTRVKAAVITAGIIMIIAGTCLGILVAPDPNDNPGGFLAGALLIIFGALLAAGGAVTPRRLR